jgi:DNA-binding MarR family transcriptional regulator
VAKRSAPDEPSFKHPDERRLVVWTNFLLGHSRIMAALELELQQTHGMSMAEYDVLYHLAQAPGRRMRMSEVSQALLYTTSGTTRLLDRMTTAGLVDREPSPQDRRVVHAVLSREGLDLLRKASATHLDGVQRHFAALLPDAELDAAQSFMSRLSAGPEPETGS